MINRSLRLISVHGKDNLWCQCDVASSISPGLRGSVKEDWKRIYEAAVINEPSTARRPDQPIDIAQMGEGDASLGAVLEDRYELLSDVGTYVRLCHRESV